MKPPSIIDTLKELISIKNEERTSHRETTPSPSSTYRKSPTAGPIQSPKRPHSKPNAIPNERGIAICE
jgi:hypothetical protein